MFAQAHLTRPSVLSALAGWNQSMLNSQLLGPKMLNARVTFAAPAEGDKEEAGAAQAIASDVGETADEDDDAMSNEGKPKLPKKTPTAKAKGADIH